MPPQGDRALKMTPRLWHHFFNAMTKFGTLLLCQIPPVPNLPRRLGINRSHINPAIVSTLKTRVCTTAALAGTKPHQFFKEKKIDDYKDFAEHVEKVDPHAIYPTNIYRQCDGCPVRPGGGGGGVGTRPWWLALLACGGAYWPPAFEPSAMTSRYCGHPHCRGHPTSWGGIQNATSAHGVLPWRPNQCPVCGPPLTA